MQEEPSMDAANYGRLSQDYERVEQAIVFLEENFQRQPELKEIAASIHLSEYHFQRLFTRWVGISPKRFLQFLTKERAKELLEKSRDVLGVAFETGLSGPGRLHDLFVTCEAVTPGEFKSKGEGLTIAYGFHPTPFGECLLAATERGICNLAFVQQRDREQALDALKSRWRKARLNKDVARTRSLAGQVFAWYTRQMPSPLHLVLSGTNFQIKVWEALLQVPPGAVVSYEDIAVRIGRPTASRAVSNAVAQNPIPVIIPCHRVIRKAGEFGSYHYGAARKKALLGWEAARVNP
jgi:AraC family transcriptional regulator of adaptative response/methylated-DNA-[protein]-cysteine methyltransferase